MITNISHIPIHIITVTDVDECVSPDLNMCDENADCVDNVGSYDCVCRSGFVQNGSYCESKIFL